MEKKAKPISKLEERVGRSKDFYSKSPEERWKEDKELGILDWDGTKIWLFKHGILDPTLDDVRDIVAMNAHSKMVVVDHTELKDTKYRAVFTSACPVCKVGDLKRQRDKKTGELTGSYKCILCSQKVSIIGRENLEIY